MFCNLFRADFEVAMIVFVEIFYDLMVHFFFQFLIFSSGLNSFLI